MHVITKISFEDSRTTRGVFRTLRRKKVSEGKNQVPLTEATEINENEEVLRDEERKNVIFL